MHSKNVFRDHPVPLLVDVVRHHEEKIESREKRVGKSDISMRILVNVVLVKQKAEGQIVVFRCVEKRSSTHLTVDRVGSGNDTASSVQTGVNSSFGDGDGLLFHDLVNGDSIDVGHLVELVDTDDSSIGEDHGSGFESTFSCESEKIDTVKRRRDRKKRGGRRDEQSQRLEDAKKEALARSNSTRKGR